MSDPWAYLEANYECEPPPMTLFCGKTTTDGRLLLATDSIEVNGRFYARDSGKKLAPLPYTGLWWGFSGSAHLGTRLEARMAAHDWGHWPESWPGVLDFLRFTVAELNVGLSGPSQMGILLGGFVNGASCLVKIGTDGVVKDDQDPVFVGAVDSEARVVWEATRILGHDREPTERRFEVIYRSIVDSGSVIIGFPVHLLTLDANGDHAWETVLQ